MYVSSLQLDLQISFLSASLLRLVQVFGLGFLFVPINLTSYIGVPTEKGGNVAGIVNFMRNIGSSVGTSMVTTLIARRSQVHQKYLVQHVTRGGPPFLNESAALAGRLNASGVQAECALRKSYGLLYQSTIAQATTLAYIDTFLVLAACSAIMFVLSFALKKNQPGGGRVVLE